MQMHLGSMQSTPRKQTSLPTGIHCNVGLKHGLAFKCYICPLLPTCVLQHSPINTIPKIPAMMTAAYQVQSLTLGMLKIFHSFSLPISVVSLFAIQSSSNSSGHCGMPKPTMLSLSAIHTFAFEASYYVSKLKTSVGKVLTHEHARLLIQSRIAWRCLMRSTAMLTKHSSHFQHMLITLGGSKVFNHSRSQIFGLWETLEDKLRVPLLCLEFG